MTFDGKTFSEEEDGERLARQLAIVRRVMSDGEWHRLPELAAAAVATTQSVSARLRDLRKRKFGMHIVERRRVEGESGVHEYRMPPGEGCPEESDCTKLVQALEARVAQLAADNERLRLELAAARRPTRHVSLLGGTR